MKKGIGIPVRNMANIHLPEALAEQFAQAAEHYTFYNHAGFFRSCAMALIRLHKAGARLSWPIEFVVAPEPKPTQTPQQDESQKKEVSHHYLNPKPIRIIGQG